MESNLLRDLDIEALAEAFSPATVEGRTALIQRLSHPLRDLTEIQAFQSTVRGVRRIIADPVTNTAVIAARDEIR